MRNQFKLLLFFTIALLMGGATWFAWSVQQTTKHSAAQMTGGNPDSGKTKVSSYGCGACHTIPGVAGAHGNVGPSLKQIGSRSYIAGVMKNTPQNLLQWIQDPPSVDPKTAMPHLRVSEGDARDIAAFLYTLQ